MRISQDAISRVAANIDRLGRRIEKTSEDTFSPLDGGYSPVAGLSEVGTIHQRVLATDPGSARNSLERFREQVAWLGDTLQRELAGLEAQDELNSRGLDVADAGGGGGQESMPIVNQPDPGYSPFGFVVPVVQPGTNMVKLAVDLTNTNYWHVSSAKARWNELSAEVMDIVAGLHESATALESDNDSETTTRAAQKIREVAQAGTHFIANSQVMQGKLFGFHSHLIGAQAKAWAMALEITAIPEPAVRTAAEQAALAHMQAMLQRGAIAAMPYQHALMESAPPSGGGDASAELGAVAGDGTRFTTDGVTWPREIQEAMKSGQMGPGSFDVANGQIQGLHKLGMSAEDIAQFHADLRNQGRALLSELGFGDELAPIDASSLSTSSATAGTLSPGPMNGVASVAPGGATSMGAVGTPSAAGLSDGAGVIGRGAGRLPGGTVNAPAHPASNPTTAAAGIGSGAGAAGASAGTGTHPIVGGLPGAAAGGAGQKEGKASSSTGSGGGAALPVTGGRQSVVGGSAAAGARGGGMRGMMPMMGGAGRGGDGEKRIKSVTTQVERDPNRRDLLGESPAVVPGVIGDWVREQ